MGELCEVQPKSAEPGYRQRRMGQARQGMFLQF